MERSSFNQHIDNRNAAGPHTSLQLLQLGEGGGAIEEHQQADADNGVVFAANFVGAKVRFVRGDRQGLGLCNKAKVFDCGVAAVEGHNVAAPAGCSQSEIAQSAPVVEDDTLQMRKRLLFEGVQREIGLAYLALELLIEEADA